MTIIVMAVISVRSILSNRAFEKGSKNVTCASKTGITSAALFLRKMKIKKIGRNCGNSCFFSQNNGHRQLLLQNDIILEINIQN
jgi:hypothetical protein